MMGSCCGSGSRAAFQVLGRYECRWAGFRPATSRKPAAMTVIFTDSFIESSMTAPKMMLAFSGGQNGRASGGEEGRGEHQHPAQDVQEPRAPGGNAQDESQRDHGTREVARDHDALAVPAVEQDARDG